MQKWLYIAICEAVKEFWQELINFNKLYNSNARLKKHGTAISGKVAGAVLTNKKVVVSSIADLVDTATFLIGGNMDITKRRITKIAREVSRFAVRTLRRDGVGSGEFDVIYAIRKNPGITQAKICEITGLDKGAVARQTANLEEKGYLIRKENPADGRSRLLFATEKAEQLKNSKAHIEAKFYEWLLMPLSEPERAEFARILDILYYRCKEESKADFPEMSRIIKEGESNE